MQNQRSWESPKPPVPITDSLEIQKVVEPPPLTETLAKVKQAMDVQIKRRSQCRVCNQKSCPHYQRVDLDTHEEFDELGAPDENAS